MDRKGEETEYWRVKDFATSIGTLGREEMSELSDISTENVATTTSPTDNTMMLGMTEKPSSSFSERVKNTSGNLPWQRVQADEAETQEEEEDNHEQDDFGSQVSLNSLVQENDAYTSRETGTMDQWCSEDN